MRAEEEGSTPGWLMHCTWQVEDGVSDRQHHESGALEVHDHSMGGNECFFTTFHRSMASTQTLMKASRASARLEFSVLSFRGQLHGMSKSWSYAKKNACFQHLTCRQPFWREGQLYNVDQHPVNIFLKATKSKGQHQWTKSSVFFVTNISNN